jgi:predicted ATPase/class 3 adenylate cyclase
VSDERPGIASFLFTDIEGSTRRWEADPRAMSDALAGHDALLRRAIAEGGGEVFKTVGDAFCATFPSPGLAIAAAVAGQRALAAGDLRVRMAVHAGQADRRDGDYYGPPLNRVARLLALAHGGQILVSRAAGELARDALPAELALRDLGEYALRDLQHPERVFQVVAPDLPADFPPLRSAEHLLRNIPRPATPLIGREREIAFARAVLTPDEEVTDEANAPAAARATPLLTLTGPGGAGKTRLALHLAAELGVTFGDGAVFVPLAEIADPGLVPAAIAAALDPGDGGGVSAREQIRERLRERHLLLVLDNLEQVMGAAPLVAELLQFCPRLRAIVTSRERLHIRGEQELTLPPLALPDEPPKQLPAGEEAEAALEKIGRAEAVRLFVERAQAVKPGFTLTPDNAVAVSELCRRLDGLPLAIELAAARARSLAPPALLDRFARRLDALERGPRDLPARQQTMRAAIAWSYDLLDPAEKRFFAHLSIFAGGADLSAVEEILEPAGDGDALEALESLVDKSLLQFDEGADEPRANMLQTIREFGQERLAASGDALAVAERHGGYFLAFAESCQPLLTGAEQTRVLDRLEANQANLRAALAWFQDMGRVEEALRLAGSLWRFWWLRGDVGEGRQHLEALAREGAGVSPVVLATALNGAGVLADCQGDQATATALHERSLALSRELGDLAGIAWSLNNLGVVAINQGDLPRARTLLEENLAVAERLGDDASIATALMDLGQVAFHEHDLDQASALWTRSLALFRRLGDESHLARSLNNLGYVAVQRGQIEEARALFAESLAHHRHVGDRQAIASTLNNLAAIAGTTGETETAERLYLESHALALEGGSSLYAAIALENLGALLRNRGDDAAAAARFGEAVRHYREAGDVQGIGTSLHALAELAARDGRVREAATLLGVVARYTAHHPELALPALETAARPVREALGDDAFAAAWAAGQEMAFEDVGRLVATADGRSAEFR